VFKSDNYKEIFDMINDAIFIHDIETGDILDVNRKACEMYGYTKEEIIHLNVENLSSGVPPYTKADALDKIKKRTEGKPQLFEWQAKDKSGQLFWVEGNLKKGVIGKKERLIVVVRDINEYKQALEKLHRSELLYRTLFENASDSIFLMKGDRFIECNLKTLKMFRCSYDQILNQPPYRFSPKLQPDGRNSKEKALEKIQSALKGQPQFFQWRHMRYDNIPFEAEVSLNRVSLSGELFTQAIVRDITERVQAEEALKQSEIRYRAVFETAATAMGIFEEDTTIALVNTEFEKLSRYSKDELQGKIKWTEFVAKEDLKKMENYHKLRRIVPESAPKNYEFKFIDRLNNIKDAFISIAMIPGTKMSIASVLDLTEKKNLEYKFQHAQRMEAIGTLAGGIAHDFNNLLMAIQGNISMIYTDIDSNHPHYNRLKNIEQCIQSGSELTRQLLGFARGGKYETKPTDINKLVNSTSNMFRCTKKEIKIYRKYQDEIWPVDIDRGQIEQVLLNIYVNAWQAMPGGGDIYLETTNVNLDENYVSPYDVPPGRYVKVSVTDTGVGMDQTTKQKVFDPFFTTKDISKGAGLGLASAYGIIKNHKGIINVYSEKGSGTTITICLPISKIAIKDYVIKTRGEKIVKGHEIILLIDDEEMILDVNKEILEQLGYEVLSAKSGKEAIDVFKKQKDIIDLVILDMIMPDMSGGETYDVLKEINPDIKVLLSTGYSMNGQATKILERGCNGFIQKPFNIKSLSEKIREILEKHADV